MDEKMRIDCPVYLLTSAAECWKCSKPQSVVAIGTHQLFDGADEIGDLSDQNDLILLSNIGSMPFEVFKYIGQRNHRYMKRYSHTAEATYFANTCECGANFGDFFLFSEPGGAFFPETEEAAAQIKYHKMPFSGALPFECSYHQGVGDFILAHATYEAA
ncbi:MAG: hypothetical protein MPW16_22020 (plasmid) [Candidatus Manganitrophus sp.]|nr:MAG: hypothetical protein MPW16_22020 [Candidatus Manganitrophus sp.]